MARLLIFLLLSPLIAFSQYRKIAGVNFVSAQKTAQVESGIPALQRISSNYICLNPFGVMESNNDPRIFYNIPINWWGDRPENIAIVCKDARKYGVKVMLKPHFWVKGTGWAGQLEFTEENWLKWEKNYTEFVLKMAKIAEDNNMESFCFGVELKSAVRNRPDFFVQLIPKIKAVYHGKLLYAANWDSYKRIPFWDQLDYIGIDAYFPLSDDITPNVAEIKVMWQEMKLEMEDFAFQHKKQIIFTEFGYRSIDRAVSKQWLIEGIPQDQQMNMQAQVNGYQGFFEALWDEVWVAGGFLWKWYPEDQEYGGLKDSDYTPQHKPAEAVIQEWYSKIYHFTPKKKKTY